MTELFNCHYCSIWDKKLDENESAQMMQESANKQKDFFLSHGVQLCVNALGNYFLHATGIVTCPRCSRLFHRTAHSCECGYMPRQLTDPIYAIDAPDPSRIEGVVNVMKSWGSPTLRVLQIEEKLFALEGSQRLAAADHLNLIPRIIIVPPDYSMFWSDYGNRALPSAEWYGALMSPGRWEYLYQF
jgi:hypothetical protein